MRQELKVAESKIDVLRHYIIDLEQRVVDYTRKREEAVDKKLAEIFNNQLEKPKYRPKFGEKEDMRRKKRWLNIPNNTMNQDMLRQFVSDGLVQVAEAGNKSRMRIHVTEPGKFKRVRACIYERSPFIRFGEEKEAKKKQYQEQYDKVNKAKVRKYEAARALESAQWRLDNPYDADYDIKAERIRRQEEELRAKAAAAE